MALFRAPNKPLTAPLQAQMYYARKRQRHRAEATMGNHGGFRAARPALGLVVHVRLVTA